MVLPRQSFLALATICRQCALVPLARCRQSGSGIHAFKNADCSWLLNTHCSGLDFPQPFDAPWLPRFCNSTMRTLIAAETKFAQSHQEIGYTCSLSALPFNELTTRLVKNGRRNGYEFQIGGCLVGENKRPNTRYRLTARPMLSGMPAFCADESGILKYDESGSIQRCLESGVPM